MTSKEKQIYSQLAIKWRKDGFHSYAAELERVVLVCTSYHSKTYEIWASMRQRCNNVKAKNYPDYGGRGIKVCSRWDYYVNFFDDMGEKPEGLTLDRINNNGNYEPGNCRWATRKQQGENKREYKNSKRRKNLNGTK